MSWPGPGDLAQPGHDPMGVARARLADALRRLTTVTVGRPLDEAALHAAAEEAELVAQRLEAAAGSGKAPRTRTDASGRRVWMPTSPMVGPENPLAPPARIWVVDGPEGPELRGAVRFGYAYEGPPTCVHGGVIAEVFDELLGLATIAADWPAMTGTLTVRYRKPTPLHTELRLLGRCVGREGRKVKIWGAIYHGEVLTAEAEGIFIEVQPRHFLELAEGGVLTTDPAVLEAMRADAAEAEEDDGDGG